MTVLMLRQPSGRKTPLTLWRPPGPAVASGSHCPAVTSCRHAGEHHPREAPMPLSPAQFKAFDEDGYLFLPDCFSGEEVAALRREAELIYHSGRPEVWQEKSGAPRTAFAAHTYNEGFRLLGSHPRLIEPVEQLFGAKLYMHPFKVNAKAAFDGDVWQWHQDYGTWARDDGMPEPRAMNISVFLDWVMPINVPLMYTPR